MLHSSSAATRVDADCRGPPIPSPSSAGRRPDPRGGWARLMLVPAIHLERGATLDCDDLFADALLRFRIFASQPRDELSGRLHRLDRADALAAAPDVAPCLGVRSASRGEVHRLRIAVWQIVGIESGLDD